MVGKDAFSAHVQPDRVIDEGDNGSKLKPDSRFGRPVHGRIPGKKRSKPDFHTQSNYANNNQRQQKYLDGDEAPPLFHMALFWDVVEQDKASPDGVALDNWLPEFPLKRAMAGSLQLEYHQTILPGQTLSAHRTLSDIYEKQGSSWPLIFYVVTTEVRDQAGEPVLTEKATRILR